MKNKVFYIGVLVLLLNSCVQDAPKYTVISIGESDEPIEINDYWNKAQVIPLAEDSVDVLGGVSKIKYSNGSYFVLNSEGTIIKQYDETGQCLLTINRQGNAHDEYLQILDFDVSDDSIYMSCFPNKILVADMAGKILNVMDTELGIADLACYEGNLYGYLSGERGVYVYDNGHWENVLVEGNLPACPHSPSMIVFHKTDGKLYCIPEGGDRMYVINGKKAETLFTMDYPDKEKISARMKEDRMLEGLERSSLVPVAVTSFVSTNDSYIMTYTFQSLVRGCEIDKKALSLKKDGWWHVAASPTPRSAYPNGSLAVEFMSQDDMPIDTTAIHVNYTSKPNLDDGQLAIIKYLND